MIRPNSDCGKNSEHAAIKLIACDLDGTLLDSKGSLTEQNIEAVRKAAECGVLFTISTGRMFHSAKTFAERLNVRIPIVCYNGAMLRHHDGTLIYHRPLDMDVAEKLLEIFEERKMYVQSYVDDGLYIRDESDPHYQAYVKHFGIKGIALGDALYHPGTPPTKLLVSTNGEEHSRELMRELSGIFGDRAYITTSSSEFVEVMNPSVNKAMGLSTLADILGLSMAEIMAVGDGDNDSEMLRESGIGVAMGNARGKAREAADIVAPTNDESGAAWAIERYVLNSNHPAGQ